MQQSQHPLTDPYFWLGVASTVAAVAAAGFTWLAASAGRRSLRLEQERQLGRRPTLVPYLAEGFCKYRDGSRLYAFSVSISNPSDIDNSIALIELQVDYTIRDGICMSVKIPATPNAQNFLGPGPNVLLPPVSIEAHQTVVGWIMFELAESLVEGSRVDTYTVLLRDSHQNTTRIEQGIIREMADEEAKG